MKLSDEKLDDYMGIIAKETLFKGLELEINVVTSSMYPTIKAQSLVKSISKKKRKIKAGDIIVFRQIYGQSLMVHRCLFIITTLKKRIYITKADSSFLFDQPVSEERVYGIVELNKLNLFDFFFRRVQYLLLPINILFTIVTRSFFLFRSITKAQFKNTKS
ncbi:MAG: hypothetical protein LBS28_03625 [Streptococcaceae bacterium]|jgi:signal peptidase I|nr:hypothetical protein [Streptococcaceae bacterium]